MNLTRDEKEELRDLGWSLLRREAKRPAAIPTKHVLHLDEDIVVEGRTKERQLTELDNNL